MQGLKWRLSFTSNLSNSKQAKQLKILWNNYYSVYTKIGANETISDTEIISKVRVLLQFVEEVLNNSNQREKTSMVDEFTDELVDIFMSLVDVTKTMIVRKNSNNTTPEDNMSIFSDDNINKLLSVGELLTTCKGSKASLSDKMVIVNEHIRELLDIICLSRNLQQQLIVLRIMKALVITEGHFNEIVRLRTFDRLSFMVENQDVKEPALIIHIMSLYRHYWHHNNISNYSNPNSHHINDHNSEKFIKANNSIENESVAPSITARSINLAVTVVSELLKLAPTSATSWINSSSDDARVEKEIISNANLVSDDLKYISSVVIPLHILENTTHKTSDDSASDVDSQSDGGMLDKLLDLDDEAVGPFNASPHDNSIGMCSVILVAIGHADCPAEAIEVFSTLEYMLNANSSASDDFAALGGYESLCSMLLRVEENLILLSSCRDSSLAAATGSNIKKENNVNKKDSFNNLENKSNDEFNLYFSHSNEGEFDYYYSAIITSLLNIIIDYLGPTNQPNSFPSVPSIQKNINNVKALSIIRFLINSDQISLVGIGVKVVYALLRANSLNLLELERVEAISSLIDKFIIILITGSLSLSNASNHPSANISKKYIVGLFSDILLVLQLVAVATSRRDFSLLSIFSLLTLHVSYIFQAKPSRFDSLDSPSTSSFVRCHNCEVEPALLECINEGCIGEQFFRLCGECDKVFHKSSVKRCHIRVPVINYHRERASTTSSDIEIDKAVNILIGSINEYSKVVLMKNNIICDTDKSINYCSCFNNKLKFVEEPHSCQEIFLNILLSAIRGILDDRIARVQNIPTEVGVAIFICLRMIMTHPQVKNEEGLGKVYNCDMSSLADCRDDVVNITNNNDRFQKHNTDSLSQPPLPLANNSRRIQLSILIQIIARFLRNQDDIRIFKKSQQLLCLQNFFSIGCDATLIHIMLDTPINSQLTIGDKQFILWLLREITVVSLKIDPAKAYRILSWFKWLLKSEVIQNNIRITKPAPFKSITITSKTTDDLMYLLSPIPPANNPISLSFRLMILQELRLLLNGMDDRFSINQKKEKSGYSTIEIVEIPIHNIKSGSSLPPTSTTSSLPVSRSNSFELYRDDDRHSLCSHSSKGYSGGTVLSLMANAATFCGRFKEILMELEYVDLLLDIFMGDLCSLNILHLLCSAAKDNTNTNNNSDHTTVKNIAIGDLEKEDWFCTLSLLMQLMVSNDAAKKRLDKCFGINRFINFLYPILHYVSKLSPNSDNLINYKAVLVNFYIDLCITEGRFSCPCKSFFYSSTKFPVQTGLNSTNSNSKSLDDFTTKFIPAVLLNKTSHSSTTAGDNYISTLKKVLFSRPAISIIKEDMHDIGDSDYYQQIFSSQSFSTSCSSISPIYFSHDSTIFQIGFTMRPVPLSLSSISIRKVFHNMNSNNSLNNLTNVHSAPHVNIIPISVSKHSTNSRPHSLVRNVSDKSLNTSQIRKGLSSLHNLDDSRWESDSNYGESNSVRRGSFSSNHSLLALSHALRPISTDFMATSEILTPTVVTHEALKVLDSYFNSVGKSFQQTENHDHDINFNKLGEYNDTKNVEPELSPKVKLNNNSDNNNLINSTFPFPPMVGKMNSVPLVFVPFFNSIGFGDNISFETNYLVLLHNFLIIRSGLMTMNEFDAVHDQKDWNDEEQLHQCKYVLRKHLSLFISPSLKRNNYKRSSCITSFGNYNWQPLFSRIKIRSLECGNLLLSLALSLSFETQAFILSSLSYLIDGNPSNAHMFVSSPVACVSLVRLIPVLKEGPREAFGYIVSQILRYSVQVSALTEIIKLASFANDGGVGGDIEDNNGEEMCYKTMLFSMGRIAESINPTTYLHFDQNSSLDSSILLPPITTVHQCLQDGFSINCWIRLGSFGELPNWSFTQLSSADGRIIIDVYFRTMYRFNLNMKDNDNTSVTSGFSNLPGDYMQSDDSSKKVIQLCISYQKSELLSETISETVSPGGKSHRKSKSGDFSTKNTLFGKQHRKELSVDYLQNLTGKIDDLTEEPHSPSSSSKVNEIRSKSQKWTRSIREFFNGTSSNFDETQNNKSGSDIVAVTAITDSIVRFSVPDIIVDLDWSEMGDWHLLNLSFGQSTEKGEKGLISCSVDGLEQNILYWTPVGYQYDSKSRKRKMAFKSQNNSVFHNINSSSNNDYKNIPLSDELLLAGIFPFHGLSIISKENPLSISLGGLFYEHQYYEKIIDAQDIIFNSLIPTEDSGAEVISNKYNKLLRYFDAVVVGFNGSIGDFSIIEGSPELSQLYSCVKEGPSVGLLSLKNNRLSSLPTSLLPKQSKEYSSNKTKNELIQFPSFLMSPVNENIIQPNSLNIYQSSGSNNSLKDDNNVVKSKYSKEKDTLTTINNIRFNNNVQIHHTSSIISAFNKIGGLKVLYPMLIIDTVRLIAGLRIIGCAITSSQEFYNDFISSGNDKVLLYCCVTHSSLLSLETLQVIFDLITHSYGSFGPSLPTYISSSFSSDSIHREIILETLFDIIIIINTKESTYYARNCIDWLREVCDETPENCQKVLKVPGFYPLLVMLSIWNVGYDNFSFEESESINISSSSDVKNEKLASSSSVGSSIDLMRKSSIKSNFSLRGNNTTDLCDTFEVESYSPELLIDKLNIEVNEDSIEQNRSSFSKDFKPIELNHIPINKYNDLPRDNIDKPNLTNQSIYVENYKLQLSCSRLIKQLIRGTTMNTPNQVSSGYAATATATGFSSSHIALLLSFAIFAVRYLIIIKYHNNNNNNNNNNKISQ